MQIDFYINETRVPPGMKLLSVKNNDGLYHIEKCPICKQTFNEVMSLSAKNNPDVSLSRGFCFNCGYFGSYTTFTPDWIDDYYRKNWTNTSYIEQIESTNDMINEVTYYFINKYIPDRNAVILDAGAGYGSSLRGLVTRGYNKVEALELSERRTRILKQRYNIPVDNIPIQDIQKSNLLSKQFDAIYLWHVLEHVSKLEECLLSLNQSIKTGGYLFIAVPNFSDEHYANLINLHCHMHSFQDFSLNYLLSRFGFEHVESIINNDGSGIRTIYKKVSNVKDEGDENLLPSKDKIRANYHEKIFKDFQLMYLVHQPKWTHNNVLLSFHYNSSFAGSCLHRYPISKVESKIEEYWGKFQNERLEKKSFMTRAKNRIMSKVAKKLAIPEGSMLFQKILGIPNDPYPFRLIYNTNDIIKLNFYHKNDEIKLWQE